ncbi:SRPBCC family protein [Teichococcus cervicalis]|uniref:SRPBCC family protein n=1 Tax=Teichococcus cervicalis TaxID=204525 RepID=UPI00058FD6BC|nr:SRPBCC family protein [Pseudoroseomonas cervicalis]
MEHHITIARPAAVVLAWLADPAHLGAWLPQLRREEGPLPREGLRPDPQGGRIAWGFEPPGEWRAEESGGVTRLTLRVQRDAMRPADPTEPESPEEAVRHGMEAALHSVKSQVERAGGGDPDLPMPDAPGRAYGHGREAEPDR